MRKVEQWSDEMKIVEKNLDDLWEEMRWDDERWDEKRWDSMNWDELRRAQMRWDEMKCGVCSVKCEECSVKCEVWSAEFQVWHSVTFGYIWNSAPLSHKARTHDHAWAWLANGARKLYRWKRPYSTTLTQLPPCLVRVLLVHTHCFIEVAKRAVFEIQKSSHLQPLAATCSHLQPLEWLQVAATGRLLNR